VQKILTPPHKRSGDPKNVMTIKKNRAMHVSIAKEDADGITY
jgi:hypothetical protein